MPGKQFIYLILLLLLFLSGCVSQFVPVVEEDKELLVVQGMITDLPQRDTIKLSRSLPLGQVSGARPVEGCSVTITDDQANSYQLYETEPGIYITPDYFQGKPGRTYSLHIIANSTFNHFTYESDPMEMKPVPPIDSVYYVKSFTEQPVGYFKGVNDCHIYLDTHDALNKCRFFRWDYTETWILRLPFEAINQTCWIFDKSHGVNIKSTEAFAESRISKYPIMYISNNTDRLKTEYSILVNQYSMNESEFQYWQKIQNVAMQVGGLYDVIPAAVPSNIKCIENPDEKVLGFFSVSAKTSRRIYIKDNFEGIINKYANCVTDIIYNDKIPEINVSIWILISHLCSIPCVPWFEATTIKACGDCTTRGTTVKPDFWHNGNN